MSIGTMLFNPFTGKPRDPRDIKSDPKGILVWDGEEPLRSAQFVTVDDARDAARYRWLAGTLLAPDYGDNNLPGEQIGWRIDNRYAGMVGVRNPVFIAGASIDQAIDAAMGTQPASASTEPADMGGGEG